MDFPGIFCPCRRPGEKSEGKHCTNPDECAILCIIVPAHRPETDVFAGLVIAVIIYAIGGGLLEVLVSPIIEACPTDNKEKATDFLSDIAVRFASMDKVKSTDNKGYKYLISFTCSSLQKTGKYNISFRIITALDEEEASNLIDNQKYYIQGKFISLSEKESINIRLDVFDDKTIEIGSIFIKEPIVTPAN